MPHYWLVPQGTRPIPSMDNPALAVTLVFKKHKGPTPAYDIAPQIITVCGNLNLKQLGLWAFPPFLQTLGPWFPNEIQHLLSSEKRTLNHWATVQFFFSLAQVRRLCDNCSQIHRHVCVWWLLMPWPQPQSIPCEVHPNSWIDFAWQYS